MWVRVLPGVPMKTKDIICAGCTKTFPILAKYHTYHCKKGQNDFYCSRECMTSYKKNKTTYYCKFCSKEVQRTLANVSDNIFCSTKCAADYRSKIGRVKRPIKYCECGVRIKYNRLKCKTCNNYAQLETTLKNYTIGEIKQLYKDKNGLAIAAKIRGYGKTIYDRSDKPKQCIVCGYSKHYEVCHIKSVSSYSDSATMAEIHSLINLVALCPNCHWEFDRGLLSLDY